MNKSDAQLDAEAAAPLPNLAGRIALHRLMAHQEVSIIRLHSQEGEPVNEERELRIPKAARARKDGPKCSLDRRGWTGLPFAHPFIRFLDESFGVAFPWSAGLKALRHECRRSHSEHWAVDEWQGSLCNRLVSLTCRFDWSYERACYDLQVTPERTERTMQRALGRIEQKLAELQARATETVHADAGRHEFWARPHSERHDQPGAHQAECPACLRRAAA